MAHLEYHHIGHDPRFGEIAIWSLDQTGSIHEQRRTFAEPNADWLNFSHEREFPEVKIMAAGRVELGRRAGSIHINDPDLGLRPTKLVRLLDTLERRYPETRWYLFGGGFKGEPALDALANTVA